MSAGRPADQAIDKLTFYRGVLFGLRLNLEESQAFFTHDQGFHEAFEEAWLYAKKTWPAGKPFDMHQDPIFGEYEEAREMLLEGEQDRLISLMNPRLQKGSFSISATEAEEELRELPHPDWFKEIGKRLAARLRAA